MLSRKLFRNVCKTFQSQSRIRNICRRSLTTDEVRVIVEDRYTELCRRFESGDPRSVGRMYTHDCQLLTYGEPPIYGRQGVERFSASFMGDKMDSMRIEVTSVEYGGRDTAVDHHRNITTKTAPDGAVISTLSSKDIVVWKCVDGEWLLHIDIYTPDPPAKPLHEEIRGATLRWMNLYSRCDPSDLSRLYTPDCKVLMDNMHLKQTPPGCASVYQRLLTSGITRIELEDKEIEELGDNLISVTGSIEMHKAGGSEAKVGKFLRICKRLEDGQLYIHWECINYDS